MLHLARMIDANFNRAREGLRVLEDLARFVLDDESLSREAKELRHGVTGAVLSLHSAGLNLVVSRDTAGDVGTTISTEREADRSSLDAIAAAAAARTTEALRVIEEVSKSLDFDAREDASRALERLRYSTYTLEKSLRLRLLHPARQWRLCVLISEHLCRHHSWQRVVEASIEGGADCFQLREKSVTDRSLLERARELVSICHGRAEVIINDRPDIAILCGAAGVHVGQSDISARDIKTLAHHRLLVGVSASTPDEADPQADYVGLGPMFPTTTKDKPVIAGPRLIEQYLARASFPARPHLAIGGIGPDNIHDLVRAGARGVAVSSAVCSSHDPRSVCQALCDALSVH